MQDKGQADEDLEAILAELDGKPAPTPAPSTADAATSSAPAAANDGAAAQPVEGAEDAAVSALPLALQALCLTALAQGQIYCRGLHIDVSASQV